MCENGFVCMCSHGLKISTLPSLPPSPPPPKVLDMHVHLRNLEDIRNSFSDFQVYQQILQENMTAYKRLEEERRRKVVKKTLHQLIELCSKSKEVQEVVAVRVAATFRIRWSSHSGM